MKKAFTIIELIVVIVIIMMLIGILLPALNVARNAVRNMKPSSIPTVVVQGKVIQGIIISKTREITWKKDMVEIEMETTDGGTIKFNLWPSLSEQQPKHYGLHGDFYNKLTIGKAYRVTFKIDPQVVGFVEELPEGILD